MQTTMKSAKRILAMLLVFALVVGTAFTGMGSFLHIADEAYAGFNTSVAPVSPTTAVDATVTLVESETWDECNYPVIDQELEINKFDITPFISGSAVGFTEPTTIKTAHALIEAVYYSIYGVDADAATLTVAADSTTAMAIKSKLDISIESWGLSQNKVYGNTYQSSIKNNAYCQDGIGSEDIDDGDRIAFCSSYSYFDVLGVTTTVGWGYPVFNFKLKQTSLGYPSNSLVVGSEIVMIDDPNGRYPYGTTDASGIAAGTQVYAPGNSAGTHTFILRGEKDGCAPAYLKVRYDFDGVDNISNIKLSEPFASDTSLSTFKVNDINAANYAKNGLDLNIVSTDNSVFLDVIPTDEEAYIFGKKVYVNGSAIAATFPNTTGGAVSVPVVNGRNIISFEVRNGVDAETYSVTVVKSTRKADNTAAVTRIINGIADYNGYSDSTYDYNWILSKKGAGKSITAGERDAFLAATLVSANGNSFTAGSAAKTALALSLLGIDASRVPKSDGSEVNIPEIAFAQNPAGITGYNMSSLFYILMLHDIGIYEDNSSGYTREDVIKAILTRADDDGEHGIGSGWSHTNTFGVDTSAMLLPAFVPYYKAALENKGVNGISTASCAGIKDIVDEAISAYSTRQSQDNATIDDNANSTAVVISALTAYGINPNTDERFIKHGKSLIDALLMYESADHRLGYEDTDYNYYASIQGLEALGNYRDMLVGGDGNDYAFTASVAPYTAWPDANLLTDISITAPTTTTYNVGDTFSLDGLVVKAIFNGNTATATEINSGDGTTGYTVSLAGGTSLNTAGVTRVNVTYRGYTQSFNIIVNADASTPYQANKVNVKVQSTSGVIAQASDLVIADGATVLDVLKTVLNNAGKTCVLEKGGTYVASIDGLGEMDKGPNSGWMYNVNNVTPQVPASDYELNNGDTVLWYYTLDFTKDSRNTGMKPGDTTTTEKTATASVETKATVTDGKATASVSASDVTKAIEQVAEQAKADTTGKTTEKEVVLEVKSTGNVDAVETTIPANAVNELAKADANVVVKTECGDIEIPADSMDNIATQAAGQELSITMENKKASEVVAAVGADKIKEETGLEGKALENVSIVEVTIKAGEKTVTSFGGKKISLSLPADNGQVAGKSYKVLAISADGSMELMTGVCVVENGKKVVKVTSSHLTTFVVTGEEVKNPFTDVSANDYFFNPVLWAVENKITSGKTADTFAPFEDCTRAQMVTFLWRAAGSPWASANAHFSDVPEGAYYAEAVEWAIAAGITKGISETTFNPDGAVTREQLASFIYRYAQSKGQGFTGAWMFLLDYSDASSVSEWADEAMHWCVMNNIVTGMSANMLAPQNPANRAQIVTMLYRYFNL